MKRMKCSVNKKEKEEEKVREKARDKERKEGKDCLLNKFYSTFLLLGDSRDRILFALTVAAIFYSAL